MDNADNRRNDGPRGGRGGGRPGGNRGGFGGRGGERRGGGPRRDGRSGGYRSERDGGRGFGRDDRRGGKRFDKRDGSGHDERRGGYRGNGEGKRFDKRGDRRFDRDERGSKRFDRDDRGGKRFDRRDDRGYSHGERQGGFRGRDDKRFDRAGHDDRRGGKRFERRDDRGFGKRDDRGFDRKGAGSRDGFARRDGDRQGFGGRGRSDNPYRSAGKPDFKKRAPLGDDLDFKYDKEIDEWVADDSLLEFFASCAGGLEFALASELKDQCGIKRTRPLRGGVAFYGTVREAYTACLWSRLASRVFYVVGRCDAKNEQELYDGVKAMPWSRQIPVGKTISVYAHGTNDELRNTQFTALRAKDGLCDALRAGRGKRPDVNLSKPDVLIDVNIRMDRATVSIDLCSTSLHHRSYERLGAGGNDGTKSALAAAALESSWWQRASKEGKPFVDPMARDGYLVTEAAMVAADMAPSLTRERWGFFGWNGHDEAAWDELLEEAEDRLEAALESMPSLYAFATDERVRDNIVAMLKRAGLAQYVEVIDATDERAVSRAMKALDGTLAGLEAAELVRLEAEEAVEASAALGEGEESAGEDAAEAETEAVAEEAAADGEAVVGEAAEAETERLEETEATEPAATEGSEAADAPDEPAEAEGDEVEEALRERRATVRGVAATILPFGQEEMDALGMETYHRLLDALTMLPRNWKYVVISDNDVVERYIASRTVVRPEAIRLGKVKAFVRRYVRIEAAERREVTVFDVKANRERVIPVLEQTSEQFAARLKKNMKERRKWADRNFVTCYRVYDADLPDYAVAIDVYNGAEESRGETFLVIAEYQAPREIDHWRAANRLRDVLTLAPIVLGVDADKVFNRTRKQEKGGGQYRNAGAPRSRKATVEENGCMFEVDFGTYLDTGLFLDQRITRGKVAELAVGKSFLNLFAYTGTATVHAAVAGAKSTLTIDLSQTYLDWAERNMVKNGLEGREHRYLRTDCMTWIRNEVRVGRHYGVIYVDPPTFSNSKSMGKDTWSVQRDHVELLTGVSRLLEDDGIAVFSCNLRTFKPEVEELLSRGIIMVDVTAETIPHDFERNPRIHRCYLVAKAGHKDALERACELFGAEMKVMEPEPEEPEIAEDAVLADAEEAKPVEAEAAEALAEDGALEAESDDAAAPEAAAAGVESEADAEDGADEKDNS